MPATAIVGAQWGDEGKGKITDLLASQADFVVRFGGGSNAGHTVVNDRGTFFLHAIPSGIFNPNAISLIGTGTVLDLDALALELQQLIDGDIDTAGLRISTRTHLVMPYHLLLDRLGDEARGNLTIGTTRRGVGPTYVDKADRVGVLASDLLFPDVLREKLELSLQGKNRLLAALGQPQLDAAELLETAGRWCDRFAPMLVDQAHLISGAIRSGKSILLEGQLGAMRDLDWGTYPYVTSSTTISGGGAVGGGVPARHITEVIGVVKAYTSAVGTGPVPAEMGGPEAEALRETGDEFGTTTGRPRRVGWFDAVATRYAHALNDFTGIAVTKLDVLDGMSALKICTAYDIEGEVWDTVPPTPLLERAQPVFEDLPGWSESTAECRSWQELPAAARAYLERIEMLVGARITIVSVGPGRDQTIFR